MKPLSVIKTDLFAFDHHRKKIDTLGDPLSEIESHIDFAALAAETDRVAPRPGSPRDRPDRHEGAHPGLDTCTTCRTSRWSTSCSST